MAITLDCLARWEVKVRKPQFDFGAVRPHWAPVIEFAHRFNAASAVPAHIEPYLIKVMMRVKDVLPSSEKKLREDIELFNKQEVQHCKQHVAFNRMLYRSGYPDMERLEQPFADDYGRFLSTKSLRFNVAYCEGFEALGSASSQVLFEEMREFLNGADENAVELWKWHLAEEFEHREVCFKAYKALYGGGLYSYLYRIAVFVYAAAHIAKHSGKIQSYLQQTDRLLMSEQQAEDSRNRSKHVSSVFGKAMLRRLIAVLSPFYDPGKMKPSPGMQEILNKFS
jgi:predicted metal-dependent hydrolase